ncbi:MAG: FAD-dependent pyridine nucleotide-disulfide oxidoreductase [Deltaproteobacteria bacterium]|nr:FAD-dependent pyridine nucleotide-disulfide oxidoreductase [Deltaproteobacteria bacterium]
MAAPPRRRISFLAVFLGLVLVAITVGLAYRGWSFYQLSLEDRPEHAEYRTLRPSGLYGNGYGWVAAVLIVMNLSYLIRRRFGGSRLGSMRVWLDIHVFTGMLAASLVSFHSAFQLRTPIATASAASLAMVVLTGLIGRFLFALTPGGGRERLRAALDAIEVERPDSRTPLGEAISATPGPDVSANASLLRSLLAIPKWRRASRVRREALALLLPPRREMSRPLRRAAKELYLAASADARAAGVSALLRSWRAIHRFFALMMLAAVLLHAGVAWYYGYRWIFA